MPSQVVPNQIVPNPTGVRNYDELADRLRELRAWSGMSYRELHRQVVRSRRERRIAELPVFDTVYRCMRPGRRRLDADLVVEIATVLLGDDLLANEWRQTCRCLAGRADDASVVRTSNELPDDLPDFVGRDVELAELTELLDAEQAGEPVVYVIQGMAGVGKTTLAVRAAHQLLRTRRYVDVQLFVNLRGYDPDRPPVDPMAVLDGFLRQLGVPGNQIAALDLSGRTAKLRELLTDRRALIVLDNAADETQLEPLLVADPGSRVLVTSRRRLAGLGSARQLTLGVLPPVEALRLLGSGSRADQVVADPSTATEIARLVGYLPLALGLVAAELEARPDWTLSDHLERLTDRRAGLRLDSGVQVALAASYDALPAEHRRLLRRLASHPGRDVDCLAATALLGSEPRRTARLLADLRDANLLIEPNAGRYDLHDLVRIYATDLATEADRPAERRAALERLLDYYLRTAQLAMERCSPHEKRPDVVAPRSRPHVPTFDDRSAATDWLDTERSNLITNAISTAEHGLDDRTGQFSIVLFRYLHMGGHHREAEILYSRAIQTDDLTLVGPALTNLGVFRIRLGRYDEALGHLEQAVTISRELGDQRTERSALVALGGLYLQLGRFGRAAGQLRRAVELARESGDRFGEGRALDNLGMVATRQGRYDDALELHQAAVNIACEIDDPRSEMLALANLGDMYSLLGEHRSAIDLVEQAVRISRTIGTRPGEAVALERLGLATTRSGAPEAGTRILCEALDLAIEHGDRIAVVQTLVGLGHSLRRCGVPDEAASRLREALAIARTTGARFHQARALDELADALFDTGDTATALEYWQDALALYQELGAPEADELTARLTAG